MSDPGQALDIFLGIARLGDATVRTVPVAFEKVINVVGATEDNDRDMYGFRLFAQTLQDLKAAESRQVVVKNNQVGWRSLAQQAINCLSSISPNRDVASDSRL